MARILVNDILNVNGRLSIRRTLKGYDEEENPIIEIQGILSTHLYFEEIKSLESFRYRLEDIEVYNEDFGSDDYNIQYSFTAKNLEVLGEEYNGATYCVDGQYMKQIEDVLYKNDNEYFGDIGEEFKDLKMEGDEK